MVDGQRGTEEKEKLQKSLQKRRPRKKYRDSWETRWPWEEEDRFETVPVLRIANRYI